MWCPFDDKNREHIWKKKNFMYGSEIYGIWLRYFEVTSPAEVGWWQWTRDIWSFTAVIQSQTEGCSPTVTYDINEVATELIIPRSLFRNTKCCITVTSLVVMHMRKLYQMILAGMAWLKLLSSPGLTCYLFMINIVSSRELLHLTDIQSHDDITKHWREGWTRITFRSLLGDKCSPFVEV